MLASDPVRDSLIRTADGYFWGLIGSTIVLFAGAIMEEVSPLDRLHTHNVNARTKSREPRKWVIRSQSWYRNIAVILVIGGIAGEGWFEYLSARAETAVRGHDEQILADAVTNSGLAKDSAEAAAEASAGAVSASGKAAEASGKATASAGNALRLAVDARKESESFEKDIVSAKTLAASAESHLADALQRTVQAEAELDRIRTPRSLKNPSALQGALKEFRGTEYKILGCFQDQESVDLLVQIDKVLSGAGWTRGKPTPELPIGDIQLNISKDFAVPITTRSGIFVGVQSTETVDALNATPLLLRPTYIRAAMLLKGALAASMRPSEAELSTPLSADPGKSSDVFIIVGKKP